MGNFYVNHTVGTPQDRVVSFLEKEGRTAFVGPTDSGWTVVCDQQCDEQNPWAIIELGQLLSAGLKTPVLAVLNHDDDLLCYWLFENGALIEQYNSCPEYFDDDGDEQLDCGGLRVYSGEDDAEDEDASLEEEVCVASLEVASDGKELCRVFGKSALQQQVQEILVAEALFAIEIHQQLVTALELPSTSVGSGYMYLADGDAELDVRQCVHIGG